MKNIFAIVALFAVFINHNNAYRILCPYPAISRSHFILAESLFKGLAAKGHEVTVISGFPPDEPIPNYRHITLQLATHQDEMMKEFVKKPGEMGMSLALIKLFVRITLDESRSMLNNPQVQNIMAEESFDLVITEFIGEPHIGIASHFNCPLIMIVSFKPNYRSLELLGNPLALSYVRNPFYTWGDLNHFTDRVINFGLYFLEQMFTAHLALKFNAFHTEYFPSPKYPNQQDILNNNLAAIFVTHHFSQGDIRPLLPNIIEISGIQMSDTVAPLSGTLQSWMDQSTNGVIYCSLGSNFKVSYLSPEVLAAILNVFSKLKQNILWKSDVATIPGAPDNVRLEKWVSQLDVLQHKNLKLFITHGGLGSVTESKFYGIPVLVIPMFADQIPNAETVVADGWGIKLPYAELTEERLNNSVNEVLENPKYSDKVKYESMLFRDRPMTPLQTGIYWVEYVIRHKGARHMRSNATQLNWFQLHSLDVIGFLSIVLIIWAYISYRIFKWLVKKIFGGKQSKVKLN